MADLLDIGLLLVVCIGPALLAILAVVAEARGAPPMTPQPSAARRGTRPHPHPVKTDSQGRHQAAAGGGAGTFSERSSTVLLGLLVACAAAKLWGVRLPWEVLL